MSGLMGLLGLVLVMAGLIWLVKLIYKNNITIKMDVHKTPASTNTAGASTPGGAPLSVEGTALETASPSRVALSPDGNKAAGVPEASGYTYSDSDFEQMDMNGVGDDFSSESDIGISSSNDGESIGDPLTPELQAVVDQYGIKEPDEELIGLEQANQLISVYEEDDDDVGDFVSLDELQESPFMGQVTITEQYSEVMENVSSISAPTTATDAAGSYEERLARLQAKLDEQEQRFVALQAEYEKAMARLVAKGQADGDIDENGMVEHTVTDANGNTTTELEYMGGGLADGWLQDSSLVTNVPSTDEQTSSDDKQEYRLEADEDEGRPLKAYLNALAATNAYCDELVNGISQNQSYREVRRNSKRIIQSFSAWRLHGDGSAMLIVSDHLNKLQGKPMDIDKRSAIISLAEAVGLSSSPFSLIED